jgi:hypothetical protein
MVQRLRMVVSHPVRIPPAEFVKINRPSEHQEAGRDEL